MLDKNSKVFFRYLKERGIYTAFLKEVRKQPERREYRPIKESISSLVNRNLESEPLMNLINWSNAELEIWRNEYHYAIEIFNPNKYLDNKYEILKKVERINM